MNLIFLLALNLLVKPFYLFGIEVGVQNEVGAEEYGLYYAMFNFTFLFNVLLDLGINNYQKISVAQDEEVGLGNMATLLPMKLSLSGLYMIVTVMAALLLGFEGRYWLFIGWLMLNHVLSMFLLLFRANLSGMHLFLRDSILSVTDRLLLILGVGYVLWFGTSDFSIETFVYFQTASYAAAIALAVLLTPAGKRWLKPNLSLAAFVHMARQTWPFALLVLLMTAYNKLDGIMLERLAPEGTLEAGIYAQAFRILDAGNSFAFLYAGLLLPMFARLFHRGDGKAEMAGLVDQAARFLIAPAGVVAILAYFYGGWVMDVLYHSHAPESAKSLTWLMGSFVFLAVGYVFGTLITASGNMKWLNRIALLTVLLNVALNYALIPSMGAEGAAMTSFISLGFMALSQALYAIHRHDLDSRNWIRKTLLLWGLTLGFVAGFGLIGVLPLYALLLSAVLSVLAFLLFVIDFKEGLAVWRNK
ncbi:MAG: oligosaccharide flippase family protein [Cryomorphaceae bacterium]